MALEGEIGFDESFSAYRHIETQAVKQVMVLQNVKLGHTGVRLIELYWRMDLRFSSQQINWCVCVFVVSSKMSTSVGR